MTIDEELDLMDKTLDESSNVPFSNKKMVDCEKMREYIDNIRLNLPGEIKRAKDMARDKKNILDEAAKQAEDIIKQAEERARVLVAEDEISKKAVEFAKDVALKANAQAEDIVSQAEAKDKAIRAALAANLNSTLSSAADILAKSIADVNKTRDAVSKISGSDSDK